MVRSKRWFGNGGIPDRCFSQSLAETVQNFAIKGFCRNDLPEKVLNGICPECNKKVT